MTVRTVLVCETQVPLVRGGAELLVRQLVDELRARGFDADRVSLPFKWYPKQEILPHAAAWGLLDLTESNGRPIDLVIATKFPTYLARHPRKVCWLVHQHRAAYELAATPYSDFAHDELDVALRDRLMAIDERALGECVGRYTISRTVTARLARYNGLDSTPLYHPPLLASRLAPGPYGDYVLSVARLEQNKRVDLAVRSVAHWPEPPVAGGGRRGQPAPRRRAGGRRGRRRASRALRRRGRRRRAARAVPRRAGRGLRAVRRGLRPGHARRLPRRQAGGDGQRLGRHARVRRRRRQRRGHRAGAGGDRRGGAPAATSGAPTPRRSAPPGASAPPPSPGTRSSSGWWPMADRRLPSLPKVLVMLPTYNERENLPVIAAQLLAYGDLRVMVIDDGSPDGTGALADAARRGQRRPAHRAAPHRQARPGPLVPRRDARGDGHRRRVHLPDGRRPLARSEVRARPGGRRRRRRHRHRLALPAGRQRGQLAAAAADPQHLRQLVRAHHHRHAGPRLHRRLPLLAAPGDRRAAARPHRLGRLLVPGRDAVPRPSKPAAPSARCRSSSSSAASALPRSPATSSASRSSRRGGWPCAGCSGRGGRRPRATILRLPDHVRADCRPEPERVLPRLQRQRDDRQPGHPRAARRRQPHRRLRGHRRQRRQQGRHRRDPRRADPGLPGALPRRPPRRQPRLRRGAAFGFRHRHQGPGLLHRRRRPVRPGRAVAAVGGDAAPTSTG